MVDKGSVSQLKNLLNYCRTLYAHYEKNKKVNKEAQLGVTNLNNIKQELEEEEDIQFNANVKQQIWEKNDKFMSFVMEFEEILKNNQLPPKIS